MSIYINGLEWYIIFTHNPYHLSIKGETHLGVTDINTNTIYIYSGLSGNLLRRVIMHELTHAYLYSYSLPMFNQEPLCSFVDTHADNIISQTDHILDHVQAPYSL